MSRIKGAAAEQKAIAYFGSQGYTVRHTNYRYKRCEIDLILEKSGMLVFVEVKYRKNAEYGFAEHQVSDAQIERILEAASHYLAENDWAGSVRFDILAITGTALEHFQDAFH